MSAGEGGLPRILHCLAGFPEGGAARLSVEIVSCLGKGASHDFVGGSGKAGKIGGMPAEVEARRLAAFPDLSGVAGPGRLVSLARAMAAYDLVLTYGWGAINAVMAHRVFGQSFALPPLLHHETAFGEHAEREFSPWRNFYRRIALGGARSVVVETTALARLAGKHWHVPQSRQHLAPRGIKLSAYGGKAARDALPGLIKRDDEHWVGCFASDENAAELARLVEQLANMPPSWHLVIFGERSDLADIRERADGLELSHRVHLPGVIGDRAKALGLLDIYVDCGAGPIFPVTAVEAMAAGLPVVAAVGSPAADLVSSLNRKALQSSGLAPALLRLVEDPLACREIGKANRAEVEARFSHERMVESYRALYSGALGREI